MTVRRRFSSDSTLKKSSGAAVTVRRLSHQILHCQKKQWSSCDSKTSFLIRFYTVRKRSGAAWGYDTVFHKIPHCQKKNRNSCDGIMPFLIRFYTVIKRSGVAVTWHRFLSDSTLSGKCADQLWRYDAISHLILNCKKKEWSSRDIMTPFLIRFFTGENNIYLLNEELFLAVWWERKGLGLRSYSPDTGIL